MKAYKALRNWCINFVVRMHVGYLVGISIRVLQLSDDDHAFLHGLPTSMPRSWLDGKVQSGTAACQKLASLCRDSTASWEVKKGPGV